MKPVLVLLPILSLTWLVSMLVHLSPAWAYATVGLNSLQVPPGPGPVWDQGSTMHWSPEGVAGLSGGWGGNVLSVMGVTSSLRDTVKGRAGEGESGNKPPIKEQYLREDLGAHLAGEESEAQKGGG